MMTRVAASVLVLSLAALTSCGGGSGGSSPPAPAPSPTATPTPSPSYRSARDFSANRNESDFGARIERFRAFGNPLPPERIIAIATTTTLGSIGFDYVAAPKSYRAYFINEQTNFIQVRAYDTPDFIGDQDFDPAAAPPSERYFRIVRRTPQNANDRLTYVGVVIWSTYETPVTVGSQRGEREIQRYHLYGAKTVSTDVPRSGSTSYDMGRFAVASTMTVTIDWSTGIVTGTGRVPCPSGETCPGPDLGELTLRGQFDGSGRFLGTAAGSAGYSGNLVGSFYGPQAAEIGVTGDLQHATRRAEVYAETGGRR